MPETKKEKKLYALITHKGEYGGMIIQVSFNKKELEEIARYLNNNIKYFSPRAEVQEVDESVCQWYWPKVEG